MNTITVKIGSLTLTKDVDWRESLYLSDVLSKYFVQNDGVWELDMSKYDGNIEAIANILSSIFRVSKSEAISAIRKHVFKHKSLSEQRMKNNMLNNLNKGVIIVYPKQPLNSRQESFAKLFFDYKDEEGVYVLNEDKVVNYLVEMDLLPKDKLIAGFQFILRECNFFYLQEQVDWFKNNLDRFYNRAKEEYDRKNTIILEDTGEDIVVRIQRKLTESEYRTLVDAFTTIYYTADQMGNLTRHTMRVIKYDRQLKAFRIPYFAIYNLLEVAKKLKFKKVINKVGWVKRKIPKPPKFDIRLYKFQEEALRRWIDNDYRGVVVAPTGSGKTYIGMSALYLLSVPTLICVTTIELARQWKQKLEEHLGIDAGLLGGGHKEIKDVTIAIYNSAVNHIDKLRERFDLVIFDECLTYDTLVLTDRGWIPIGEIVERKLPVKVLTHKGRFMPVIGWHKIPLKKRLVKVVLEDGTEIKCTEDHKFLTSRGWVEAVELTVGDILYKTNNKTTFVKDKKMLLSNENNFVYDITVAEDHSYVANGVIVHNCHHVPAEVFRKVAFRLKARKRLGLSATPERYDKNEALLFFSVGKVVYQAKYQDMVRLKLVAPLKYYRIYVSLAPDEEVKYLQESKKKKQNIQGLMKISFMARYKYDTLKKILEKLPNDKILIFCEYVDQAKKAYKVAREVAGNHVALITGETKSKLRKKYFEEFKEGKKKIIVTTTVLDEGIDVPDAETAIIMSGKGTERQMIQRIGRVIRYRPNKVAKVIEIVTRNTVEERIANRRCKVLKDYGIGAK